MLKPGGKLYCCVPFLQPYHGCPHHYYNMTKQGLYNLFADHVRVTKQAVGPGTSPIFAISAILKNWSEGLDGDAREEFLNLSVRDFMGNPFDYLHASFVEELSEDKNFELASCTILHAVKR